MGEAWGDRVKEGESVSAGNLVKVAVRERDTELGGDCVEVTGGLAVELGEAVEVGVPTRLGLPLASKGVRVGLGSPEGETEVEV